MFDQFHQPAPRKKRRDPTHLHTAGRGEADVYFHLRRQGYIMVARNFRYRRRRGEIDLIGWDKETLCFIEIKPYTAHDVKFAEGAADQNKGRIHRSG
jgi:putative endonuclease